jgi:hypothetical protein
MEKMAKEKIIQGITGEYYVAAKLSSFGLIVSMTVNHTPKYDILVTDGNKERRLQIKTTEGPKARWTFGKIVEQNSKQLYILVILKPKKDCDCPDFYIVPGKAISAQQKEHDEEYTRKYTKRHGKKPDRTKKGVFHFSDPAGKYKNNWKALGLELSNSHL